jgi:hypothetical protein
VLHLEYSAQSELFAQYGASEKTKETLNTFSLPKKSEALELIP